MEPWQPMLIKSLEFLKCINYGRCIRERRDHFSSFSFFFSLRTWVVNLPMSSDDLMKEIRGNKVAFQDCFISNLAFLLTFPVITIAETPGDLPLTLPRGSPLMSTWSSCIPTFAVLLTDTETFQTNNSFRTWTRIRVPPGILSDAQRHNVSDVALFNNGIMFLINGAIYLKTKRTFEKLDSTQGVPETEIIGIQRRRWCPVRYLFKVSEI